MFGLQAFSRIQFYKYLFLNVYIDFYIKVKVLSKIKRLNLKIVF